MKTKDVRSYKNDTETGSSVAALAGQPCWYFCAAHVRA
jgi:hypothetical protein